MRALSSNLYLKDYYGQLRRERQNVLKFLIDATHISNRKIILRHASKMHSFFYKVYTVAELLPENSTICFFIKWIDNRKLESFLAFISFSKVTVHFRAC